jgi:hypothetical protein
MLEAVLRVELAVQSLLAPEIVQRSGILLDSGGAGYQTRCLRFGSALLLLENPGRCSAF